MDSYFFLKFLHILSATVLLGTGAGIAYFMLMAYRSGSVETQAVIAREVVKADWLFTAPAIVTQLVTGLLLMKKLNYSFTSAWFMSTLALFLLVGCCWVPVIIIQYKLKKLANASAFSANNKRFLSLMRLWIVLGIPAFIAMLVIMWLMVVKPLPVV